MSISYCEIGYHTTITRYHSHDTLLWLGGFFCRGCVIARRITRGNNRGGRKRGDEGCFSEAVRSLTRHLRIFYDLSTGHLAAMRSASRCLSLVAIELKQCTATKAATRRQVRSRARCNGSVFAVSESFGTSSSVVFPGRRVTSARSVTCRLARRHGRLSPVTTDEVISGEKSECEVNSIFDTSH